MPAVELVELRNGFATQKINTLNISNSTSIGVALMQAYRCKHSPQRMYMHSGGLVTYVDIRPPRQIDMYVYTYVYAIFALLRLASAAHGFVCLHQRAYKGGTEVIISQSQYVSEIVHQRHKCRFLLGCMPSPCRQQWLFSWQRHTSVCQHVCTRVGVPCV